MTKIATPRSGVTVISLLPWTRSQNWRSLCQIRGRTTCFAPGERTFSVAPGARFRLSLVSAILVHKILPVSSNLNREVGQRLVSGSANMIGM